MSSRPPFTEPLQLGGRELLLSPLSFEALEEHAEHIRRLTERDFQTDAQAFDALQTLLLASLKRRHPDFTLSELRSALDLPTARDAVVTVLRISFPAQEGEARVGSPSGKSTGPS